MPGRDKPLITRNGIPDPQAYNPQTGQWESFIGVSWGKTAGGLYVPIRVDDQGRQEVTLSGSTDSVSVVNIPAQDRVSIEPGQIYNLASVDFEGYRKIMVGIMLNVPTAAFKVHIYSHHLGGSGIFGSGVRATSHDLIRAGGDVMYAYFMEEPTWAMGQLVTVRLENVGDVPAPLRTYEIRRYA